MSANVYPIGAPRQLDRRAEPEEQITEEQAKEPARVARLLMTLLRSVALLKRRWWPHRVDFKDVVITGTSVAPMVVRFPHGLGPVVWWPVRVRDTGFISAGTLIRETSDSNESTLVLEVYFDATIDIRIEEAGA